MCCYFKVINFKNDRTSYHTKIYELFKTENPNVAVTGHPMADQRRTIVVRGLLVNVITAEIKMQRTEELQRNTLTPEIAEEHQ